jgi:hypothetical protein
MPDLMFRKFNVRHERPTGYSGGGKPPVKDNKEIQAPKGRQEVFLFQSSGMGMRLCRKLLPHFVFVIKTMVDSRIDKCPSHVKRLFCRPFGACYIIAFTRGFTPGYILSALRACCRTKRLFALFSFLKNNRGGVK